MSSGSCEDAFYLFITDIDSQLVNFYQFPAVVATEQLSQFKGLIDSLKEDYVKSNSELEVFVESLQKLHKDVTEKGTSHLSLNNSTILLCYTILTIVSKICFIHSMIFKKDDAIYAEYNRLQILTNNIIVSIHSYEDSDIANAHSQKDLEEITKQAVDIDKTYITISSPEMRKIKKEYERITLLNFLTLNMKDIWQSIKNLFFNLFSDKADNILHEVNNFVSKELNNQDNASDPLSYEEIKQSLEQKRFGYTETPVSSLIIPRQ